MISDDISPQNENFEYSYPHSNALLQFCIKLEPCKPHIIQHCVTHCDIVNDVKLFPTVRGLSQKVVDFSNSKKS